MSGGAWEEWEAVGKSNKCKSERAAVFLTEFVLQLRMSEVIKRDFKMHLRISKDHSFNRKVHVDAKIVNEYYMGIVLHNFCF